MAMINPSNGYCIYLVIVGPTIMSAILILVDSVHSFYVGLLKIIMQGMISIEKRKSNVFEENYVLPLLTTREEEDI